MWTSWGTSVHIFPPLEVVVSVDIKKLGAVGLLSFPISLLKAKRNRAVSPLLLIISDSSDLPDHLIGQRRICITQE